jgi:hypothetical protein
MTGSQNKISVNLSPEARKRLEIIRAYGAAQSPHGETPTYKDLFEYLIYIAPVDKMLAELSGANQPRENADERFAESNPVSGGQLPADRSAPADGAGRRRRPAKKGVAAS